MSARLQLAPDVPRVLAVRDLTAHRSGKGRPVARRARELGAVVDCVRAGGVYGG